MKIRIFEFLPKFEKMPTPKRKLPRLMFYGKLDKQTDKIFGKHSLITIRFLFDTKIKPLLLLNKGYNLIRVEAETIEEAERIVKANWRNMEEVAKLLNWYFTGFKRWE